MAIYEDAKPKTNWTVWYGIAGALSGLLFVALFLQHQQPWFIRIASVVLGYAGGYVGVRVYKLLHCSPSMR